MVCKQEDAYIFEQPRWIAHLSNGEKVYKDDGRPGENPPQAWLRLADYCRQTGLYLVNLTLQFRSHHEAPLPANAEGYFFRNKAEGIMNSSYTAESYLIGYQQGELLHVQQWKIPELIKITDEIRSIESA